MHPVLPSNAPLQFGKSRCAPFAAAFAAAYDRMIERANELHGVFGKSWIRWVTPATPPEEFDFTAGVGEEDS